jgi:hypothetical protein
MSAGFHRLGTNVEGKVTGYHAASLPIGVVVAGKPLLPTAPSPRSTAPNLAATLVDGEIGAPAARDRRTARLSGYTGDTCTNCFSLQMKRNGSCLVCEACGATTGCS